MSRNADGDESVLDGATARRVAGRARTLHERLTDTEPSVSDGDWTATSEVFDAWREQFGADRVFQRRLNAIGLDRSACVGRLAHDRLSPDTALPEWIGRLRSILAGVTEPTAVDDRTAPFTEIATAVARHAAGELSDGDTEGLTEGALAGLRRWLRERIERWLWRPPTAAFRENVGDDDPSAVRPAFVSFLFDGGLSRLCVEYPVYARLLVAQVDDWLAAVRRLAARICADRERLAAAFETESLGAATAVEPTAASETGAGGATLRVSFGGALSVAYKPRPVDADVVFYDTVERVFKQVGWKVRTPTVLDRGTHGWVEWIDPEPCDGETAVQRYYTRLGGLMCIAYFLGTRDLSAVNVVAAGDHPVVVDAETAVTPVVEPSRRPTPTGVTGFRARSVLATLLLPYRVGHSYEADDDTAVQTAGAVSAATTGRLDDTRPTFDGLGTGTVTVERTRRSLSTGGATPTVDGDAQPVDWYTDAVVEGFQHVHRAVTAGEISVSPAMFTDTTVRYVYRGNQNRLRERLCRLDALADGATYGRVMDHLAVPLSEDGVAEPPWGVLDAERRALERLRTPRFVAGGDGTAVTSATGRHAFEASESGVAAARTRIAAADTADRRRQTELIRGATGATPAPVGTPARSHSTASTADLQAAVARQVEVLQTTVVPDGHGGSTWGCLSPASPDRRVAVSSLDHSLAVGRTGVAAFLAAAGVVLDRDTTTAVRRALPPSVTTTKGAPAFDCHDTLAVARTARALSVIGDLAGDVQTRETAVGAAQAVDPTDVQTAGASAAVADALATVAELTDTASLRKTAVECAAGLESATVTRRRVPPVPGARGVAVVAERLGRRDVRPYTATEPAINRTDTDDRWTGNAARVAGALAADDVPQARRLARQLTTLRRQGEFRSGARTEAVADPTFAYGRAGIGYTLCRVLSPKTIPRLLLL